MKFITITLSALLASAYGLVKLSDLGVPRTNATAFNNAVTDLLAGLAAKGGVPDLTTFPCLDAAHRNRTFWLIQNVLVDTVNKDAKALAADVERITGNFTASTVTCLTTDPTIQKIRAGYKLDGPDAAEVGLKVFKYISDNIGTYAKDARAALDFEQSDDYEDAGHVIGRAVKRTLKAVGK